MIELYQTEWCPYSSRVRQRLTELGIAFVARPVAPDRDQREDMRAATGTDSIPTLVVDGEIVAGDTGELLAYLDRRFAEPPQAEGHRRQAAAH